MIAGFVDDGHAVDANAIAVLFACFWIHDRTVTVAAKTIQGRGAWPKRVGGADRRRRPRSWSSGRPLRAGMAQAVIAEIGAGRRIVGPVALRAIGRRIAATVGHH